MTFSDFLSAGLLGVIFPADTVKGTAYMLTLLGFVLLCSAAGYFAGCFNSAIFFSKKLYGTDIRTLGSGNAGMTNMFRSFGKKAGFLTLAGDVLKTVIAVFAGFALCGTVTGWLGGFFCMLGHMFPAFSKFRGGKGVLVAAITILLCNWPTFLVVILIFAVVLIGGKMVSLASVMAALTMPLMLNIIYKSVYGQDGSAGFSFIIAFAMAVFVIWSHRENIKRIRENTEPKIRMPWEKKKGSGNGNDVNKRTKRK